LLWRVWCFLCGLAPGALAGWVATAPPPDADAVRLGALAGGALLVLLASAIARIRDDEPALGTHLAAASSAGLAALPGLVGAALHWAPGAAGFLGIALGVLFLALWRASRARGPVRAGRAVAVAVVAALAGGGAFFATAQALWAALGAPAPMRDEAFVRAVWDVDAGVAPLPLPRCAPEPAGVETLLGRGARPRLGDRPESIWFDAQGPDGRRDVYLLHRATGEVVCATCEEPGDNWRPAPTTDGQRVVFTTNRHARWSDPANTELHVLVTRVVPRAASRRVSYSPGPDDFALFAPASVTVVWSRWRDGRLELASAGLRSAHGGLSLGPARVLASAGAGWIAALGWSRDARALALSRGNPFRPAPARALDPATGETPELAPLSPGFSRAVSFGGDGTVVAVAGTGRGRVLGLLPASLGFLLAPAAQAALRDAVVGRGTSVSVGPLRGERVALALGPLAEWGEPTGIALEPDGTAFVLGQRRAREGGVQERLVRVVLDCAS